MRRLYGLFDSDLFLPPEAQLAEAYTRRAGKSPTSKKRKTPPRHEFSQRRNFHHPVHEENRAAVFEKLREAGAARGGLRLNNTSHSRGSVKGVIWNFPGERAARRLRAPAILAPTQEISTPTRKTARLGAIRAGFSRADAGPGIEKNVRAKWWTTAACSAARTAPTTATGV